MRTCTQHGGKKSRMKKFSMEKCVGQEKVDSDEGSCAPMQESNLCWEKKDTQVLCYFLQHFVHIVDDNFELIVLIYYSLPMCAKERE